MTLVADVSTESTLWMVDLVRAQLSGHPVAGVEVDVGVLGLPRWENPRTPDGLVYPVRLYAGTVLFGPLHQADGSSRPCARCLDRRWLALRPVEERRAVEDGADYVVSGRDPAFTPFALEQILQIVLAETAAGPAEPGAGRVVELDLGDFTVTRHGLIADSECERCAHPRPDTAADAVLELGVRPKRTPTTYRGADAADLVLPAAAYVGKVCGLLGTETVQVYQCSATLPVSGYFRVRSKYDYHEMWWSGQSQSVASSERYGMLEGLERYAGQYPRAKEPAVHGSYDALAPDALDPTSMGSYRPEFYDGHPEFYQPFDRALPMRWTWGYSFGERRPLLVPEQLVFYLDRRPDRKFVQECSNGCASGTSAEEALLHGMLELIERDAFLLCWYGGARLPEIDVSTCADQEVRFMVDRVGRLGYRMRLFDIRVDMDVPAVMAVAERRDGQLGTLCFAAGASLDPIEAVRSAVSETASYIPGMDERVTARHAELRGMAADYREVRELSHHALLYGLPEMASVADFLLDSGSAPQSMDVLYRDWLRDRPATSDLADDVRFLLDRIETAGSDVVVVDQTCPEQEGSGIRTLCVLAPGLIPIDFGWERQRVLDHPRLRSFLDRRLDEVRPRGEGFGPTGLNATPHPFP